jgi:ornithine cyclodeaminase/alanine dehydrogenase-like protein (mu-crystallin family)
LTERDVRAVLPIEALVDAMEEALAAYSSGRAQQPTRTVIMMGDRERPTYFGTMPAHLPTLDAAGLKLVTVCPPGPDIEFTHRATILLVDPATGVLRAAMDGRYITEMRTAAVSAVAVRHLARRGIRRIGIIGSGVQAESHVAVLTKLHSPEEVRVWSRGPRLASFVEHMSKEVSTPIRAATSAEDAVSGADVVILVTASTTPVVQASWVEQGALVISVGACRPDHREMDPDLVARAWLVVDSRTGALVEAGDIVQGIAEQRFKADHIRAELGEVARAGPTIPSNATVIFKSLGMGVEDVATAQLVYDRATAQNVGQKLSW